MVIHSLKEGAKERLERAQAGEFMLPQWVDLPRPVSFRCPHCGTTHKIKQVQLQSWPERRDVMGGLVVICPACGDRQQVDYVPKKGFDWTKIPLVYGVILVLVLQIGLILVRAGILPLNIWPSGGGTGTSDGGSSAISSTSVSSASNSSEEKEKQSHYEVVRADVTWDDAEEMCEKSVYNGVHGHLAVLSSQDKYDAAVEVLNEYIATHPSAEELYHVWIGGWIEDSDAETHHFNYHWVNKDEWSFDKWCYTLSDEGKPIVEPSYYDENLEVIENRLVLWGYQRDKLGWTFSDQNYNLPNIYEKSKGTIGFICEYEETDEETE